MMLKIMYKKVHRKLSSMTGILLKMKTKANLVNVIDARIIAPFEYTRFLMNILNIQIDDGKGPIRYRRVSTVTGIMWKSTI